jgi:arylsulfatase A-like enzyme/protein tyrosine/serine phosphatase
MMFSYSRKLTKSGAIFLGLTVSVLFLMSFRSVALAAAPTASPLPAMAERIKVDGIDHFARMDTDVYRGATPTEDGLRALAREHVKTLVCLRSEIPYTETAQELGLRVLHLPLSPLETPNRESILRFLDITTDPSAKPVFFHCLQGEDRTGVMAAVYRMQVQGWSEEMALAEMKEFGFGEQFIDLKKTLASYREAGTKATADLTDKDVQASVEAGNRLLAEEQFEKAIPHFQAALQKNMDFTEARLGLAQALSRTRNAAQALSEIRQAMIRAGSQEERVRVARVTIKILAETSARGELPSYGLDIAEREWALLELVGAEDQESLLRLGEVFERGLYLSRALEAFERARIKGGLPGKDIERHVERIRSVHSYAPRSELGKQLGLMPQVNRGEVAALLVQELRVDRLRALQGSPTWQPTIDKPMTAPEVKDTTNSREREDIKRVLSMGIRGLEPFPDQTFRPGAVVSRAEFVVILEDVLTRATRDQTLSTQLLGKSSRFNDVEAGAWYQSAADLARGLGLFEPPAGEVPKFKPLDPITGVEALQAFRLLRKRLDTRSRAIVLLVDALRDESVYYPLDKGRLPNLSRIIQERGVVRFERCLAELPSVTLPNHTTIFTGTYASRHRIPGNEWFDRNMDAGVPLYQRSREYVKYGTEDDPGLGRSWSFGGLPIHDMDLSPEVRTVYEAFKEAEDKRGRKALTAVVFDPVRRGADKVINPDLLDALISLNVLPFINQYALLDKSAMKNAVELIKSDDPPELMGIWLSGLDGWCHAHGPGPAGVEEDRQASYVVENIDPLIGLLVKALEDRGLIDETVIFIVADHGHADAGGKEEYAIDAEKVYRLLAGSPYRPPIDKEGHLDRHATDFGVAVMANSNANAALISIRTPGADWKSLPTQADLEAVANVIIKEPYVSRIFFLKPKVQGNEPGIFMLTPGEGAPTKTLLNQESEQHIIVRALGLAGSSRSGDLLVEAKSPYYFAPWGSIYRGQHGRGERMEDHVPLIIVNPPGGRHHIVKATVEIVDIGPTVAGTLGFMDFLPSDGKDLLDPPRIFISSHAEDQSVPAGQTVSILGFVKDSVGIQRVEFRVGDEGAFNAASGGSFWEAQIKLPPGRHAIFVRAIDETGLQSTVRFHLVAK